MRLPESRPTVPTPMHKLRACKVGGTVEYCDYEQPTGCVDPQGQNYWNTPSMSRERVKRPAFTTTTEPERTSPCIGSATAIQARRNIR